MRSWKWPKVRSALKAKGFVLDRLTNHEYYRYLHDGKITSIRTKISHGSKGELNLGTPLSVKMQKQLHLTKKQFQSLLDCPMSAAEYAQVLRNAGHIEP